MPGTETKIAEPGVYDLSMDAYLGQPCAELSLSSTDACILTSETPKHLRAHWSRERVRERKADLGTAIHTIILEPARTGSTIAILDFDNFQTKDARKAADEAMAAGMTPLLRKDHDRARRAADAVLAVTAYRALLEAGKAEQTYIAKDKGTGVWVKTRPDLVTADRRIVDIKSVTSCSPDFLKRRVYDGQWFRQAPWQCHVFERVMKAPAKDYLWICVEQDEPFDVVHHRPTATALSHGARLNEKALGIFAECLRSNTWPGYLSGTDLDLPDYAYYRLEADGLADEPKEPTKKKRDMRALELAEATGADPFV